MAPHRQTVEIRADSISKTFGSFQALKGLSLTIGRGEFLTLLGPSGSGKTTFLMILAGFLSPTGGRLHMDGKDITDVKAEERSFGMVFQGYALFPHMSVANNIAFPLRIRRRPADEIKRRVGEMIERVGLAGHGHKSPSQLSGGQQQRVALARALVFEPAVLLLDEPFSALDKTLREAMQAEVKRLHTETGTTFVFVTHDQSEALALSSRIAIFNHGEVLQVGTPQAVYERPESRFVAEFLGQINLLPLADVAAEAGGAAGLCEGVRIGVRAPRRDLNASAMLAVRPEHMALSLQQPADRNGVPATVVSSSYLGSATQLNLVTRGGVALSLSVPANTAAAGLAPGAPVWATWPADQGFLLPDGN